MYIKNHFDLLLHVSTYDHHQGAFIDIKMHGTTIENVFGYLL